MKNKLIKILSIVSIVLISASSFVFSVSAAGYDDYIGYWRFKDDIDIYSYIQDHNTELSGFSFTTNYNDREWTVYQINLSSTGSGLGNMVYTVSSSTNFIAYGVITGWYASQTISVTSCNEALANFLDYAAVMVTSNPSDDYNRGYEAGYAAGYNEGYGKGNIAGYGTGYRDGESAGYNAGYDDGVSATGSQQIGKNLLVDTLTAPMNALNQFVLYESSNGLYDITLGDIVGGVIAFSLFIAFLKLFAGG